LVTEEVAEAKKGVAVAWVTRELSICTQ